MVKYNRFIHCAVYVAFFSKKLTTQQNTTQTAVEASSRTTASLHPSQVCVQGHPLVFRGPAEILSYQRLDRRSLSSFQLEAESSAARKHLLVKRYHVA